MELSALLEEQIAGDGKNLWWRGFIPLLTAHFKSDIFVLLSDKYISLEDDIMKNNTKHTIILGVICTLLAAAASWYTITFNDSRLIVPMDLSEYVFRVQDLPMIISGILITLYVLYLFVLLVKAIDTKKKIEKTSQFARAVSPKLGFLGFAGFLGFLGFWTYSIDKTIFPFIFFMFFGYFGFFYEGKMSNTFMDERYMENKRRAQRKAHRIAQGIVYVTLFLVAMAEGRILKATDTKLIILVIAVACSIAVDIFLGEYLLYQYDHEE